MKGTDNMAHTTQVSFRIDEDIKKDAEIALEDMWLTMSAAITVFLKIFGKYKHYFFYMQAFPILILNN